MYMLGIGPVFLPTTVRVDYITLCGHSFFVVRVLVFRGFYNRLTAWEMTREPRPGCADVSYCRGTHSRGVFSWDVCYVP